MTEDDLAQVRAALTDEVLEDSMYAVAGWARLTHVRDVVMSALAPLVRPAPTCATCEHWTEHGVCSKLGQPRVRLIPPPDFGCSLHTPRPSTPEGSASR